MNINDFKEGIELLQNNYHKIFSTEQLKLYYENLKDMNKEQYISNIKEHIRTCSFLPNVAQIRNKKISVNYEQRNYEGINWDEILTNTYT